MIIQSIEPGLRETLSNSYKLGSFRFEKVILGDTPLRIRGVKVYDEKKTDRNEIIMDLDVSILILCYRHMCVYFCIINIFSELIMSGHLRWR